MQSKILTIRLPQEQLNKWRTEAARRGYTLPDLIRELIEVNIYTAARDTMQLRTKARRGTVESTIKIRMPADEYLLLTKKAREVNISTALLARWCVNISTNRLNIAPITRQDLTDLGYFDWLASRNGS